MKFLLICLSLLVGSRLFAGDAVAMGYNADGVWTAVTYNRSSTPKRGAHYRSAAKACAAAVRDLYVRAPEDLARTKVISDSDLTGYVSVARGRAKTNMDVTVVTRARSQAAADKKAFARLDKAGATENEKIVYRYFSYGADSK